jgi:hypothetical protein
MGGPACQGKMIAKVEEIIADDRTSKGMAFSKTKMHVICPWHGYEFDIRTGVHPGNTRARLRKIKVAVSNGEVTIGIPDAREQVAPDMAEQAGSPREETGCSIDICTCLRRFASRYLPRLRRSRRSPMMSSKSACLPI